MIRTQIYLDKTQVITLKKIAQKRGVTFSQIIRSFVDKKITPGKQKEKQHQSLLTLAQALNKKGKRAPRDLAKKLDLYLYE